MDLFEAIQNQEVVYLVLDSQRCGEAAKQLGRLILQDLKTVSGEILDRVSKRDRTHCMIIVDEFADLATDQFVGLLYRARSSKLGIIVSHPEIRDLDAFSATMRDQVMGNTATNVAYF